MGLGIPVTSHINRTFEIGEFKFVNMKRNPSNVVRRQSLWHKITENGFLKSYLEIIE